MITDPLAPLLELPGVAEASEKVRDELARAHRHKTNVRGWAVSAAEASLRAARASSVLDGGPTTVDARSTGDPVFAGALRVAQALEGGETSLVEVWRRAPLQALARLHVLAAADLVDEDHLGRPTGGGEVGRRLELLADLAAGGTRAPAPVFAAVVHGELLTLAPFGSADGVVARGAARLVTIASGLDRHGLGVPEVHWMRKAGAYRRAAQAFADGSTEGVTDWLLLCCGALHAGALDALGIAEAGAKR
ncbi:oxidoreductase [Mycobacterium sp. pW045]|uniref:oxidoreductase n=1 Tax=Mycobacterium sp. pW045 TaxID=3238984 RepID=UPI00351BCD57